GAGAHPTAGTDQTISHAQPADTIGIQSISHMVAQPPQLLAGRRIVGKKFLAEPERTERQTGGFAHAAAAETGDLKATSAEIEEDAIRHAEPSPRADKAQACLRQSSDDFYAYPELSLHTLGEA